MTTSSKRIHFFDIPIRVALDFIKDIGHRKVESTGEKKATSCLMQTIGMGHSLHSTSVCLFLTEQA